MKLGNRLVLALVLLGSGAGAQVGLQWHLYSAESNYRLLEKKLADFPQEFQFTEGKNSWSWKGKTLPLPENFYTRKDLKFDEVEFRNYSCKELPASLELYLGYSRVGDDRKHHPIVCMDAVMGIPEDASARTVLHLDSAGKRQLMRFRFRKSTQIITVYYWHYTLPLIVRPDQNWLQILHNRISEPAPSLTVQVYISLPPEKLAIFEKTYLPFLDNTLVGGFVPSEAAMGWNWLNINVVKN